MHTSQRKSNVFHQPIVSVFQGLRVVQRWIQTPTLPPGASPPDSEDRRLKLRKRWEARIGAIFKGSLTGGL
jgi:hypothetical protein